MGSLYEKRGRLWMRFKQDGKWRGAPTPFPVEERTKAEQFLRRHEHNIAPAPSSAPSGAMTVGAYLERWTVERRELGKVSADADLQRLTDHAPAILAMRLDEVRPRHIRELVLGLRKAGTLAPRTIRNVYAAAHALFHAATCEELIAATPCVLARGVLPKVADKDPTWRAGAIFTREEVVQLISDKRVALDHRILLALKALAGLRHGEAARLRWKDINRRREPLAAILLGKTKSGVPRAIPVHPTLARILGEWILVGWETMYGRAPGADDLVVPTRTGLVKRAGDAQHAFGLDLERVGLRHRRGHDLRRTFITLAQTDGARRDILETVSHGPRGDIMSVYSSFPWAALCAEVAKLSVETPAAACYHLATKIPNLQIF